jgi:hypothetical protein
LRYFDFVILIRLLAVLLALCLSTALGAADGDLPPVEGIHARWFLDDQKFLPVLDSHLTIARRQLIETLRDSLNYIPDIYLVGDLPRFETLVGGRFPDWGAAAALPFKRLIALKSPDRFTISKPLSELVAHEYSHLALAHRTGLYHPPRWFDEGLAMYVSREWGWTDNVAMGKASLFRQFIPLEEIEEVNRFNGAKAEVAYSESFLAVKYFIDRYKLDAVNRFLDEIARGRSIDSAMSASVGGTMAEFDREYHEHLNTRYNLAGLFMDTIWLWIILAFVVVIGGILKIRQRRTYYKKWEDEEKLQSTEFDYGDSRKPEVPDEDDDEAWRG